MPRNLRNFWLELDVDGSRATVTTGPRSKDGGFSLTVFMRDAGGIVTALELNGLAASDGKLRLLAHTPGQPVETIRETER